MSRLIAEWEATAVRLARKAGKDARALDLLLQGIHSNVDQTRYTSFKALMRIAGEQPELLYSHWDQFARLIDSKNAYSKYMASYLIASLTPVDKDDKFEQLFGKYFGMLNDRSVIPAAHVAANSGKIVRAKPRLEPKITEKLLAIDKTRRAPRQSELIKGYAIEAFSEYFGQAKKKESILRFVRMQLDSLSPRTRARAKEFLERWGK